MSMLVTLLLVSVTLVVPATALVFTVRGRHGEPLSWLRATGAATVTAVVAVAVAAWYASTPLAAAGVAVVLGGSVLAWRPVAGAWAARGLVAWALTIDAGILYLAYVLHWTFTSGIPASGVVASLVLWSLELFILVVGSAYVWEFVDVLTRRVWTSYVDVRRLPGDVLSHRPFVSLHVPTHNEPPDMVIETLRRLLVLDYDDYEVLLIDNNTTDEALWRPVADFCEGHDRITFIHLEDWPGYKSGALNHALTRTDPRAEVIGIVDADYLVESDFLARCAPLFQDDRVAFVQTPQDYRSWEHAPYFRRLYHSYGYFFDVSQRSRNERNGAIFGGTMGLIRRSALTSAGGWDEWCITEDAELSLRLLRAGDRGLHVEESFGHGVMPLTFEALKRQRFRWCFGGVQILRMHWRSLLPGPRTHANRLTGAQRWAYLSGGLQWFGDLAGVMFTGFLLAGALDAVLGEGVVIRRLSGLLLLAVVVLLVLGMLRALALIRRTSGASWSEAWGAFGLWLALGWTVAQASARGLVAREGVFLRTPKTRGELGWRDALRGNRVEFALALVCLGVAGLALAAGSTGGVVVGALLAIQGFGYSAAPVNSLAAIRSDLPPELRRRRREWMPSWERLAAPARRGGVAVGVLGLAGVVLLALAAPLGSPDLTDLPDQVEQGDVPEVPAVRPTPSGDPSSPDRRGASAEPDPVVPVADTTGPGASPADQTPPAPAPPGQAPASQAPPAGQPTQATVQPAPAPAPTAQPPQQPAPTQPTQATQPPAPGPTGGGGNANPPSSTPSGGSTGRP